MLRGTFSLFTFVFFGEEGVPSVGFRVSGLGFWKRLFPKQSLRFFGGGARGGGGVEG